MACVSLESIINRNPQTAAPDISVQEAIALISQTEDRCLLIVETAETGENRLVGLLSDREIVQLIALDKNFANCPVRAIMVKDFTTLKTSEEYDLATVIALCNQQEVKHLPIIDAQDHLVGLITQNCLMALTHDRLLKQKICDCRQMSLALQISKSRLNDVISSRQKVEETLKRQNEFLNNLINTAPNLIFAKDWNSRFVLANQAVAEIYQTTIENLIGKNDADFNPNLAEVDRILQDDREVIATEKPKLIEETVTSPTGEIRYFQTIKKPIQSIDGKTILALGIAADITERKQAEAALTQRERYLEILVEIQQQLLATKQENTYYVEVLKKLGITAKASRVYLFENHRDRAGNLLMSQRAEWCAEGIKPEIENPVLQNLSYQDSIPRWRAILASGKVINGLVAEFPESERMILESQGILSILVLPLIVNHEFWGFIGFDNCQEARAWSYLEVRLLSAVASAISLHLERKQAEQALPLILEGTAAKTGNEFFHSLVRYLAKVLQVRYAFLTQLIQPEKNKVRTLAFWQGDSFGEDFEYEVVGTPCEGILANEIIYYSDSIQGQFPQNKHLAELNAQSLFGVPLNDSAGNVIGYLKVIDTKPLNREPTSEQILRIFAARAGAELERIEITLRQAEMLAQTQRQSIELEKAKNAAEAANFAKSEFLANMSHELRTPLNAILGFTQVMSYDTFLKSEHREYINIINRSGQYLLDLINDVLEMSKIEAGKVTLHPTSFNLYHLLNNVQEMLQLKANAKNLALIFDRSPHLPQYITTDESKLRQVLLNLLGNAIKFTTQGYVTLRVRSEEAKEQKNSFTQNSKPSQSQITLYFEVEDTGVGIASEEMSQLFKPFVQTSAGRKSSEGTGLGLALSCQYVHLMNGEISVESVVGQGSLFRFHIQVQSAQATNVLTLNQQQRVIGLAPNQPVYRLLIVEDQWENSQVLVQLLQPVGFEVKVAKNGQEGIEIWQNWQPHLILMDMRMPIMNGYEATRRIKLTPEGQTTKIIAVTGSAFEENRSEILEIGCDDFIRKPFRTEVIFAKLTEYLGVQYIFAEMPGVASQSNELRSHKNSQILSPGCLEIMPKEWLTQFYQAAVEGRDHQLLELIEQIPEADSDLALALSEEIDQFNFPLIIMLTGLDEE
ncbi:response regulator [Aerosakkonemataceae cyanobacterium BLCC-F154]|uniref:histidine kinase n=1 Tax=Floridaenema fluviatile BLCC-F154 TaxID=3153640 RepID=A0ABV4YKS2_9CYAN